MNQMEVTEQGNLQVQEVNPVLKVFATLFSWVFHPLFILCWVVLYLLFINDAVFLGLTTQERTIVFLRIFATSVFLPIVTVLLLKGLGFIQSIQLKTQKERIIPYVASITFFFWSFYVARTLGDPVEFRAFLLAMFISASVSLYLNNYFKISMHAVGVGGMMALFVLMLFANKIDDSLSLIIAFLVAGITTTSRLIVSDHRPFDIYSGFILGIIIQWISWIIVH